jgi:hypothetical protein
MIIKLMSFVSFFANIINSRYKSMPYLKMYILEIRLMDNIYSLRDSHSIIF